MRIADAKETGQLGVIHIKRLWSRNVASRRGLDLRETEPAEWVADNTVIYGLGLGLAETMRFLHEAPTFENFEAWILEKNGGSLEPDRVARINAALSGHCGEPPVAEDAVLTPDDLSFWDENGYVVLHDAVPHENCQAAVNAILEFTGADLDRPETWYKGPQGHSIWIPVLHHPALRVNRRSKRIYNAFAQLWGRTDLWETVDQGGFNPPERPGWIFPGPHLHWDVSLALPVPFGTQGILYLTDTAVDQGAFTCVPGFHRRLEDWLHSLPADADPRQQDLRALGAVPIAGKAGDLIVWHHMLPHGSSPNKSARPRIVQYINMRPSQWESHAEWK